MTGREKQTPVARRRFCLYLATGILAVAAIGQLAMVHFGGFVIAKSEVPLNYPIVEFTDAVSPRFVLAREINTEGYSAGRGKLTPDVIETLGTEEFISWLYKDRLTSTEKAPTVVRFHMAYYTALLDAVPHVPDNCMVAGGLIPDPDNTGEVTWTLPSVPAGWEDWSEVTLRRSSFVDPEHPEVSGVTVFYVFSANGKPMWDRRSVRLTVSKPWEEYCYYMKIEISPIRLGAPMTPEEAESICRDFFTAASGDIFKMMASPAALERMENEQK